MNEDRSQDPQLLVHWKSIEGFRDDGQQRSETDSFVEAFVAIVEAAKSLESFHDEGCERSETVPFVERMFVSIMLHEAQTEAVIRIFLSLALLGLVVGLGLN